MRESASAAILEMNETMYKGRRLRVEISSLSKHIEPDKDRGMSMFICFMSLTQLLTNFQKKHISLVTPNSFFLVKWMVSKLAEMVSGGFVHAQQKAY